MKKKLILKILNELDKNNKILSKEEVNADNEQYGQIFDIMIESHFISGVDVKRVGTEGKYSISGIHPKITLNGIEYLERSKDNYNSLLCAINNIPAGVVTDKYEYNINRTYI